MHKTALLATLAASSVAAQDLLATVIAYNADDCGANPNNPDLVSLNIEVFKDVSEIKKTDGKVDSACMYSQIDVPGWPQNGEGLYDVHVDENTIPDTCELVVFQGAPTDDKADQGECWAFYRRVPSDAKCTSLLLPPKFGYAMCCGADNCNVDSSSFPVNPPGKRGLPAPRFAPDVTKVKRTNPFQRRADCSFKSNGGDKSILTYGPQVRISQPVNCGQTDCTDGVDVTIESSTSNSFGASVEIGGELLKAITGSISFTYDHTEEHSASFSTKFTGSRPAGSEGYVSFLPRIECSPKGVFDGDCQWDTGKEGDACWPVYLGGGNNPDGQMVFVQTN